MSGGRDNPHFTNGDPSIAISDVLKAGPAEGKLMINDRVISANSVSLEGVDYATAVQVLRDSGQTVNLVVKRRVVLPSVPEPQNVRVSLTKNKKKEDFGVVLGCKIYIKEITSRSVADKEGSLQEGDLVHRINNLSLDGLSLKEARKLLDSAKDKLEMTVRRDPYRNSQPRSGQPKVENGAAEPNQNLYVPPPSRKEEKNNLAREARMGEEDAPPRPPLPREEGNNLSYTLLTHPLMPQLLLTAPPTVSPSPTNPGSEKAGPASEAGTLPIGEKVSLSIDLTNLSKGESGKVVVTMLRTHPPNPHRSLTSNHHPTRPLSHLSFQPTMAQARGVRKILVCQSPRRRRATCLTRASSASRRRARWASD